MLLFKRPALRWMLPMNLEAAKATVREIIRLASIRDAHFADAFDRESAERKCNQLVHNSTKALAQLLEAVTNLEKLEAEWRAKQAVYLKAAKRNARRGNTELAHEHSMSASDVGGFADDLKRLLHPEDK